MGLQLLDTGLRCPLSWQARPVCKSFRLFREAWQGLQVLGNAESPGGYAHRQILYLYLAVQTGHAPALQSPELPGHEQYPTNTNAGQRIRHNRPSLTF